MKENAIDDKGTFKDGIGEIQLSVQVGNIGPPREQSHVSKTHNGAVAVTEKEALNEGLGVSLAGDGKLIAGKSLNRDRYKTTSKMHLPPFGIKIFVRDQIWLMSRRIVDPEGRAFEEDAVGNPDVKPLARSAPTSHEKTSKKLKPEPAPQYC